MPHNSEQKNGDLNPGLTNAEAHTLVISEIHCVYFPHLQRNLEIKMDSCPIIQPINTRRQQELGLDHHANQGQSFPGQEIDPHSSTRGWLEPVTYPWGTILHMESDLVYSIYFKNLMSLWAKYHF